MLVSAQSSANSRGNGPHVFWQRVHVDFEEKNKQLFLVLIDSLSKWIEVFSNYFNYFHEDNKLNVPDRASLRTGSPSSLSLITVRNSRLMNSNDSCQLTEQIIPSSPIL